MGVSRLCWSGVLLMVGLRSLAGALLPPPPNESPYVHEGKAMGHGFVAAALLIGSAAFAIQHFRRRHDYDGEDHYE